MTGSRRSLLLAGVTDVDGLFHFGDVIEMRDQSGVTVARGIAQYDSVEVRARLADRASGSGATGQGRPLVHADDLVAL